MKPTRVDELKQLYEGRIHPDWAIKAQQARVQESKPGTEERAMREAILDRMTGRPGRSMF